MNTKITFKKPNKKDITDLNNKMFIVFKVLQACMTERDQNKINIKSTLDRLVAFTGLSKQVLCKVWDIVKAPQPTDKMSFELPEDPEIDLKVRQALITQYVIHNKIPSLKSLNTTTFPNASPHQIRQNLKRCGYIWKQVPNTKRAIIVERPERVIQRQRYLQQMDCYRIQKRSIVYVEVKILDRSLPEFTYFENYKTCAQNSSYVLFVTVATKTGYIGGIIRGGLTPLKCKEQFEQNFIKNILPHLPKSSVIVIEDGLNSTNLAIPTIESEKSSMIDWLNINNIPHDETSHRCELLDLIENCKDKRDLYKFDEMLRVRGHEILRRPQRTNYLSYFKSLWKDIFNTKEKTFRNEMITDKPRSYWLKLENNLVAHERVVYEEDIRVENVIDKVLTMAKDDAHITAINRWAGAECDDEEDTLKQEEYLIHYAKLT